MHRGGKMNKIQFALCWILFVTRVIDAMGPYVNKREIRDSRENRILFVNVSVPSGRVTTTPGSGPVTTEITDEQTKNSTSIPSSCVSTPNITMSIEIIVNDKDNTTNMLLNAIDGELNLTKHDTLAGFPDQINRVKKSTPVTFDVMSPPSPKILKKKETGHGKIFLLSSFISNGNIDTNNYDHNSKRNTKDEPNHSWKYRKPAKYQKMIKTSLLNPGVNSNIQDAATNKLIFEMYGKNANAGNHGGSGISSGSDSSRDIDGVSEVNNVPVVGEAHDVKKMSSIVPSRVMTLNSNLLIDYLFPSMFKNMFTPISREYEQPAAIQPARFNDISYTDKLLDGWFNLKDESPLSPIKCTCHMRKPDDFEDNSKIIYPKEKFAMVRIPHTGLDKQDNQYESMIEKDPNDKSMILSL